MPQINRIRIINFSYNRHKRNILDETFDLYQGENTLMSMKNGGGKSVLVQLMLQPIIPKSKLMGRRMEDFFKDKKSPSYIMIEWKLEDKGGYLLTGIAIANRTNRGREIDEINNSLKYFTFTTNYRESNEFDIENISLIKKTENRIYVEDYRDVKKYLIDSQMTKERRLKIFTDEERQEYGEHLLSFNISQEEFRSLVLKINESEGGVIEIFEKCKTSMRLMNDWILEAVEKVVNREDEDHVRLERMLQNLAEEIIKNEEYVHDKEIYQNFLKASQTLLDKLNVFVESLDKEENLRKEISKLYYYLKKLIEDMYEESKELLHKKQKADDEKQKIELEERSKRYYDYEKEVNEKSVDAKNRLIRLEEIENKINVKENELSLQEAAGMYNEIKGIRKELAGIKEEIDKIKQKNKSNEKITNLEYSLKVCYANEIDDVSKKIDKCIKDLDSIKEKIIKNANEIDEIDIEINKLYKLTGKLKANIKEFESYEKRIKKELDFYYERNLLNEIKQEYIEEYDMELEQNIKILNNEEEKLILSISELKKEKEKLSIEVSNTRGKKEETLIRKVEYETEKSIYYKKEQAVKKLFEKYDGLKFERRFNHSNNISYLQNTFIEMQKRQKDAESDIRTINETISSLKDGVLHLSREFTDYLKERNINFETGENYLRKLDKEIRDELVKNNPLIPFSILLYKDEIEALKELEIDKNIHSMIPIYTYKDIEKTYKSKNRLVEVETEVRFLCLYDQKMIATDNIDNYIQELKKKLDNVKKRAKHYEIESDNTRKDIELVKDFSYEKKYIYELEDKYDKTKVQIEDYENRIKEIDKENIEIDNERENNIDKINSIEKKIDEVDKNKEKFSELIEKDKEYLENTKKYEDGQKNINIIDIRKKKLLEENKEFQQKKDNILINKTNFDEYLKSTKERYLIYKDAKEASIINDNLENLEERLLVLKRKITSDLTRLESECTRKEKELSIKVDKLNSLSIKKSEYENVHYDLKIYLRLNNEIKNLKISCLAMQKEYQKLKEDLAGTEANFKTAKTEVEKLAPKPLLLSEIKLNFNNRRISLDKQTNRISKQLNELSKKTALYERIIGKIEGSIDIKKYGVDFSYKFKKGPEIDLMKMTDDLRVFKIENNNYEREIHNKYLDIKAEYRSNRHIVKIFEGLDSFFDRTDNDTNNYIAIGERIIQNRENIEKLMRICQMRLINLENSKRDMIKHSYLHAKQVFEEIQKIAQNSSIRLEDRKRPIPMLRIKMEELSKSEEDNTIKMKNYIEECTSMIKDDMKKEVAKEEIGRKVSRLMSTKELLNVLSDLGKMSIEAYKIDINTKNNEYKTWERLIKENSGGERFVSFFCVLVALMSYTRTSMKYEDNYKRNRDTKVLIMDNPFGPISSEHLLKPLFKIAEKYNTQLICLTDLKQNSILNCFDLIYMIKIRLNELGTQEYLQIEEQIDEDATLIKDEMLEKAKFKTKEVEQINMLD